MSRTLAFSTIFLLSAASLTQAAPGTGLTFDVETVLEGAGGTYTMRAAVRCEGESLRADYADGGFAYSDGATIITTNGGRTYRMFDPERKSATTIDLAAMRRSVEAYAGGMLKISDTSVNLRRGPADKEIGGYPAKHYILEVASTVTMNFMGSSGSENKHTIAEYWLAEGLSAPVALFFASGVPVTDTELYERVASELAKMKGLMLAMRSVTTSSKSPPVETTVTLSNVAAAEISTEVFAMPAGYRETAPPGPLQTPPDAGKRKNR